MSANFTLFCTLELRSWSSIRKAHNHANKRNCFSSPYLTVADLRHTFAVISLENGDDVKTVQQNLGHSTASFTLDVYGHVSDRMRKESAARMDQFINNVSSLGTDFN